MAKTDAVAKNYMQDREFFADAFNYLIYDGGQVIKPENLKPLDATSIAIPYGKSGKIGPIQKYRDVLKLATVMKDDRAAYVLLGIENQSEINYAMPVRNMLYDALQYIEQIEEIRRARELRGERFKSSAEFLSGLTKADKLTPVITLTIYFGAEQWTGPRDVHSMLSADEEILRFVNNHALSLIVPADITQSDFRKFNSEFGLVMKYVKYSNDRKKLREMVGKDAAFRSVSRKTANMINVVTHSNLNFDIGEERVDMCNAIEGIRNDAREEGLAKGLAKGRAEGRVEGRAEGRAEGMAKAYSEVMKKMRRNGLSEEQIKLFVGNHYKG